MHFLLRLQLTSLKFSYVLLILHSKVPACRVTLRRPGELKAFASVLLGQGQSDLRAQCFLLTSTIRRNRLYVTCLLNLYHNMYIYTYTLYPYIHYICIYMYVYCDLQVPFIAHHCLSLFLMFHGELRNLKPLRRAFRLMPRSILQGAHGSDICSYVPQLPDFLGAVKEQIDQEFNSIASWPSWLVFSSFQLYLTTSQQLCLWIPASKRIKFQIFRCVTAPMTMSLRPNGTLRVTWVVFDESPNPASAKSLRVNLSRSF